MNLVSEAKIATNVGLSSANHQKIHNFACNKLISSLQQGYNIRFISMKKYAMDFRVGSVEHPRESYVLLKLKPLSGQLPEMRAGQFVEVRVDQSPTTFLRRPISINYVDEDKQELWLLVHAVGDGTKAMSQLKPGDTINCVLPLGNGFTVPEGNGKRILLVGGGVGTAPLLQLGKVLKDAGHQPTFLLGGRTGGDLMQLDLFRQLGEVYVTTEDASMGEKGFVTNHSVLNKEKFDSISTCGPKPMMIAVARWAMAHGVECEASLENLMACGLGACLCCVEKDGEGHNVCVCKEGPVFNVKKLSWLN